MRIAKKAGRRIAAAAVASGVVAAGTLALAGSASASTGGASYRFSTLDNARDVTFNQLLGINDEGLIAGYFGSGAQGHPNQGYLLSPPYGQGSYSSENFPGSVQTQVTGLNNRGVTVGFWSSMNTASMANNNFGFFKVGGRYYTVNFPTPNNANPPVNQLLGVNDSDVAVGFYTDGFLATPAAFTTSAVTINLHLQAMPQGTVSLGFGPQSDLTATIDAFGLTPGSSHTVELVSRGGRVVQVFGTLTANGTGQADVTLDSRIKGWWALGSKVEILNGTAGGPVSAEPIAQTSRFLGVLSGYQLHPVEAGYGTPGGTATLVYNPAAQTITVTVTASGLTPGAHAAHIHLGSCMSQGPVRYMLMDFTANGHGQIMNQTRTVTGVTSPVPATGWYLNLHQGNSYNILANGAPAINFRPLLCANI
jgi:CHRD domain